MRKLQAFLNLRSRLLLLVLLAVLPAFALIIYSAWEDRANDVAEAERQTRQLASIVADEQARLIDSTRQMLVTLSNLPIVRDPGMLPKCSETLARIRSQFPYYGNIGMVNASGALVCSALPFKPGSDNSDRSWFQNAVKSRGFAMGDYLIGRQSGLPSLAMSLPVFDNNGGIQNVMFAAIDLSWMEAFGSKLSLPPGAAIVVVDAKGTVLLRHPDPHHTRIGKPAPEKGMLKSLLSAECRGYAELRGLDGVFRINAFEPLQRLDGECVYVRVGVPKDQVFAKSDHDLRRNLLAMAIISLLVFVAAWFGSDWIVLRRVRALTHAARQFGSGDLAARTGLPHSEEELGQLAKSFDEMAAGVQAREARLNEADRALNRTNRALTVLSTGNRAMLRAKDEQSLLDDMCRMVVEKGGYRMVWVGYVDQDETKTIRHVAHYGCDTHCIDQACLTWDEALSGNCPAGAAIRSGKTEVVRGTVNRLPPTCKLLSDCAASLALPLSNDSGVFGVVTIYSSEQDSFDEGEIELLVEAAADVAYGIARLRDQVRRAEAEDANRIKSEFLANMSHELRTPLNAIIGFSDVLKDGLMGDMPEEQREYVVDIYNSGRHLLSLINDILDLSKVEAGKMTLDLETMEIDALLGNSLSVIKEKAAAHRISLEQQVPDNLEPIQVDPRKIKQIVYNLLSNAVKFTPDGGRITLRARRASRGEVENWSAGQPNGMRLPLAASNFTDFLEIAVEDTGIGIKQEDTPRLFQPFSQIDSSLSRRYEGTGLGLAMVMKMAELHGGTVAVSSEPGKGSCFTIWLPWRKAFPGAPTTTTQALPREIANGRVALVVEDNDRAAELVRLQVESEGLEVVRVSSAEEALKMFGSIQPNIIILDIFLPGMDGWELLAKIKEPGSPWNAVPVVIASIVADAQKGFLLGAAEILQKPVTRDELAAALHRVGIVPVARRQGKILIVDDDQKSVEVLSAYLSDQPYTILRAYGGKEGIETAQRELPELILLDLMMPEVSGFDVVDTLRANPATAAIPIVIVTSKQLTPEDRYMLNGYVTAILEKTGFNHDRFVAEVRLALAAGERRGA